LHLYAESITLQRQHVAGERPPRRSRGHFAAALAVAAVAASGCAAIAALPSHTPAATAQSSGTAVSARVPHVGMTARSFVRRIRALEARGYVEVACKTDGDLMFNARTHRYETVRA
jgi:hypothetical protein